MKTFVDNSGKSWELRLTPMAVERIRDTAGVNLTRLLDRKLLELIDKITAETATLFAVLYAAMKPELEKAGITREAFSELMYGDVIAGATKAFIDELIDFFLDQRDRGNVRWTTDKAEELAAKRRVAIGEAQQSGKVDALLQKAIQAGFSTPGPNSTNAPASPESTPTA